jgi:hypothetical protein
MIKYLVPIAVCGFLQGCANRPPACPGSTALPAALASQFEPLTDAKLLTKALGGPGQGGLCLGQVYQAKADSKVVLFRAWNSDHTGTWQGHWWAFDKPEGRISSYRENYAICYQWTPLDMLVQCRLRPGAKVVVGPGQSMECPQQRPYHQASATLQVFVADVPSTMDDCSSMTGMFSWQ